MSVLHLLASLKKTKLSRLCDWEEIMCEAVSAAWLALLLSSMNVTSVWGCHSLIAWVKKASTFGANSCNFTFVDWAAIAGQLCFLDISLSQHFLFPHLFHLPLLAPLLPQPGLFDLLRSHWGSSSYSFEVHSDLRVLGMHTLPLSKLHQALPTLREALSWVREQTFIALDLYKLPVGYTSDFGFSTIQVWVFYLFSGIRHA